MTGFEWVLFFSLIFGLILPVGIRMRFIGVPVDLDVMLGWVAFGSWVYWAYYLVVFVIAS